MSVLKTTFREFLEKIADDRRDVFLRIYDDHKALFHHAPGSSHNHQAWVGGYADHIAETFRVNEVIYDALSNEMRPLEFSKASATICLFLHDIEKPFRYGPLDDARCVEWQAKFNHLPYPAWENAKWEIIDCLKKDYGFELTDEEINAIKYTHGEGDDYRKDRRVSCPLAAHVHHCDNTSARVWPLKGKGLSLR